MASGNGNLTFPPSFEKKLAPAREKARAAGLSDAEILRKSIKRLEAASSRVPQKRKK